MKILAIHNFHRKGSASGDDQVFKSETALLESHGNQVIKYTVSNDEFDNAGLIGKLSATFGMLWSSKNYRAVRQMIEKEKPDIVLVHGDTSTAFAASLAAFYQQIPVGHVEAGLRTYNMKSPYPEEFNRQAIGLTASLHFAPTQKAADALLKEGKDPEQIFVTGNTGIDALHYTVRNDFYHPEIEWAKDSRLIAVTAHRRENLGEPMRDMFRAIHRIVEEFTDVKVIYPVHLNPLVRKNRR